MGNLSAMEPAGPAAVLERAGQIADEVLFPAAMAAEAAGQLPAGQLDLLAAEGFYGMAGPPSAGGLGLDLPAACRVIEVLAGGCLSTAFVWLQHHGAVRAVLAAAGPDGDRLRRRWLARLCRGEVRAGIALGGAVPGPPQLRARRDPGGWRLDGTSAWVTGWGLIDVVHAAARDDQGNVVTALLPAQPGPALSAEPLPMVAVMPSRTVQLRFDGLFAPGEAVTSVTPHAQWQQRDALGLRPNGSLSLGVAARCCALLGRSPLDAELAARRDKLDAAPPAAMPAARAAAAELAMRAAAGLVAAAGSRSVLTSGHPQRLAREALFLLVFGSRPAIKSELVSRLTGARA